jgi:hypothetical protein
VAEKTTSEKYRLLTLLEESLDTGKRTQECRSEQILIAKGFSKTCRIEEREVSGTLSGGRRAFVSILFPSKRLIRVEKS